MILGGLIGAVGYALLVQLGSRSTFFDMLPGFILVPAGMGLAVPAMTTASLSSVDRASSGTASGVLLRGRQAAENLPRNPALYLGMEPLGDPIQSPKCGKLIAVMDQLLDGCVDQIHRRFHYPCCFVDRLRCDVVRLLPVEGVDAQVFSNHGAVAVESPFTLVCQRHVRTKCKQTRWQAVQLPKAA